MVSTARAGNSGRRRQNRQRFVPMSGINVTPIIDVLLVLIVLLAVSAPLIATGIPLVLPRSTAAGGVSGTGSMELVIDRSGVIVLGGQVVPPMNLAGKLTEIRLEDADVRVEISADRSVKYGDIVAILEKIQTSGIRQVGLRFYPQLQ